MVPASIPTAGGKSLSETVARLPDSEISFTSLDKDLEACTSQDGPCPDLRVRDGPARKGGATGHDPNAQEMDRSIKPGDDFYGYANGGWLRTVAIPAGQAVYDTRALLMERTSQRVRDLIQAAAAGEPVKGTSAQKVGDYYASFMDVDPIDAKGMTVLAGELAAISAIHNTASLSAYLGATLNSEVDGLTANADHIFGVFVNQGFEDSKRSMFHLLQGGLGLPGRDAYLDPSPKGGRVT
jgi:putative endopeptidase